MESVKKRNKTIIVDYDFYKNVFEPGRRRAQLKLGVTNLSQSKFTKMLDLDKISLNINPRIINAIKNSTCQNKIRMSSRKRKTNNIRSITGVNISNYKLWKPI